MKKIVLCLIPVCIFLKPVCAQQETDIKINPSIEAVTVYLNGAEIKHSKEVQVKRGTNKIIFQKLSPYLNGQSVQVAVDGDAEVQSVTTQSNYLNIEKLEPRIKLVKDSITLLNTRITSVRNELDAYNAEKALLNENKNIGNKQTPTSIIDIDKAADFYRQKTLDIDNAISKLTDDLTPFSNQLALLQNQLQELNYKNNPERMEVVVVVNSSAEKNITLHLRYTVTNAGWEPSYDLVSTDISKPIQLKYKAKVYNNTGINWENVPLTLSTADPSQSASRPYLTTWSLNYSDYDEVSSGSTVSIPMENNMEGLLNTAKAGDFKQQAQKNDKETGNSSIKYATVNVSELSTSFPIANPYTIPSDAKPYQVDITSYSLDATYSYIAVPKLDNSAFLIARISGWEKLNLIDGPMNVYFNNSYVGQSAINTRFVEDTLELSLGRDNQILVTRTKKEDFGSKKLLGSSRKESFKYEIIAKNNKSEPINIQIQDQLPVSSQSDIIVDADETSGASLDIPTGKLQWKANLKPGASVNYSLSYSIKYPKNKQVHIAKYRQMDRAYF